MADLAQQVKALVAGIPKETIYAAAAKLVATSTDPRAAALKQTIQGLRGSVAIPTTPVSSSASPSASSSASASASASASPAISGNQGVIRTGGDENSGTSLVGAFNAVATTDSSGEESSGSLALAVVPPRLTPLQSPRLTPLQIQKLSGYINEQMKQKGLAFRTPLVTQFKAAGFSREVIDTLFTEASRRTTRKRITNGNRPANVELSPSELPGGFVEREPGVGGGGGGGAAAGGAVS
jgi:hypothetical protein